jgi:hypothetical protein
MPLDSRFEEQEKRYTEIRSEFLQTVCRKCRTKNVAVSWDVDIKTMVDRVGEPFGTLYFTCYVLANLHVHATLASAFQRESIDGTPDERNQNQAEFAVMNAILTLLAVVQSQDKVFSLGLANEIKTCQQDVDDVWKDRPHGPRGRKPAQS